MSPEIPPTINFLKWFAYMSLVILTFVNLLFLKWIYADTDIVQFHKYPIPVRVDGGVVILQADYCKSAGLDGQVRTSFVSQSREIFLPVGTDRQPKGCVNSEIPIIIPRDLPMDSYHIHIRANYQLNPIKHSIQDFDSVTFKVGG